ncbi:MAG: hypothetical protein GX418_08855 [Clostridiales bacterium]|nr:hypothetical protein [Clostridiales bacterium]
MDSLLVLLIHLAKKWGEGSERRFWQVLWDEILDDPSYRPSGYFYDDLQKAICNSGKQVFTLEGNKRRFCEFIQYHALAPLSSFHAFVSLIWNAYLDEDLFNANYRVDDLLVGRIVAWLKMKFIGIDDSQINDGFEFDGKTYSIRAAFKYAFIHNSMDEMIWLVQKILMCIDRKYYREAQTSPQDYMDIVCDQYVEKLLFGQISLRKQRLSTQSNILIDISRAYAAYELDEVGNPVLFMPDIRMIDFNENQIQIKVFSNEELITTQVRYIVGEGLRRRLKRIDFQLFDLLPQIPSSIHLRLELWGNAQLLYSSQELLFRSFLLFTEFHEVNCTP